jgi:hypothetical protein
MLALSSQSPATASSAGRNFQYRIVRTGAGAQKRLTGSILTIIAIAQIARDRKEVVINFTVIAVSRST